MRRRAEAFKCGTKVVWTTKELSVMPIMWADHGQVVLIQSGLRQLTDSVNLYDVFWVMLISSSPQPFLNAYSYILDVIFSTSTYSKQTLSTKTQLH